MIVYSLFDGSGLMVKPWAEAGHTCYCFNYDGGDHGDYADSNARVEHENIHYINVWLTATTAVPLSNGWIDTPDIIFSFPPCTDIAVSGSRHFARKLAENPRCQLDAVSNAMIAHYVAISLGVPYMIENPVSVLSTMWRKPDYIFDPCDYGAHLPEDDEHPFFPGIIPARDAYNKKPACGRVAGSSCLTEMQLML